MPGNLRNLPQIHRPQTFSKACLGGPSRCARTPPPATAKFSGPSASTANWTEPTSKAGAWPRLWSGALQQRGKNAESLLGAPGYLPEAWDLQTRCSSKVEKLQNPCFWAFMVLVDCRKGHASLGEIPLRALPVVYFRELCRISGHRPYCRDISGNSPAHLRRRCLDAEAVKSFLRTAWAKIFSGSYTISA